jgi:hypothetical protein
LKRSEKRGRLRHALEYIFDGKFDPTNPNHRKFVSTFRKK